MTMAFLPVVKEAAQSLFDFFNGFAQTARKHVDEMTWGIRQFYEAVKSLNIIKWIGADAERSFAALQAVILTFAAAAILWLGGMLAAAAPFLFLMAAIGLVLQDIYVYMQGGDSLIGRLLGSDVYVVKLVIEWLELIWTLMKMLYAVSMTFLGDVLGSPLMRFVVEFLLGALAEALMFVIALMLLADAFIRVLNAGFYLLVGAAEALIGALFFIVGLMTEIITLGGFLPEFLGFGNNKIGDKLVKTGIDMFGHSYNSGANAGNAVFGGGSIMDKIGRANAITSSNPGTVNNIMVNNTVNSVNAPATSMALFNDSMNRVNQKVAP